MNKTLSFDTTVQAAPPAARVEEGCFESLKNCLSRVWEAVKRFFSELCCCFKGEDANREKKLAAQDFFECKQASPGWDKVYESLPSSRPGTLDKPLALTCFADARWAIDTKVTPEQRKEGTDLLMTLFGIDRLLGRLQKNEGIDATLLSSAVKEGIHIRDQMADPNISEQFKSVARARGESIALDEALQWFQDGEYLEVADPFQGKVSVNGPKFVQESYQETLMCHLYWLRSLSRRSKQSFSVAAIFQKGDEFYGIVCVHGSRFYVLDVYGFEAADYHHQEALDPNNKNADIKSFNSLDKCHEYLAIQRAPLHYPKESGYVFKYLQRTS